MAKDNSSSSNSLPPATAGAIVAAAVAALALAGFFAYRAAQPHQPTAPGAAVVRSGVDPKNPARPPVADEHANDWRPPAPAR